MLNANMGGTQAMIENRRQFVRVDDYLPMKAVPVAEKDVPALRDRIQLERNVVGVPVAGESPAWMAEMNELLDQLDGPSQVFRYIFERLEYKLDLLLQLTAQQQMVQQGLHGSVRCDLSGGGVRFESAESYPIGQPMEIEMFLRDVPPVMIKCLAEVVRVEDNEHPRWSDQPYRVSVKFTEIVDPDRERIIRYVFGIQRHLLRVRNSQN